jgi:hypothetical protein
MFNELRSENSQLLLVYVKGPGEEHIKSMFIHFLSSLPFGSLKCVLSNSTNRIWENELCTKI